MQKGNHILDKAQQQLASSKNTPIEAGPTEHSHNKEATIDAVNRVFAEFELVYHNQFTKAFPTLEKLQYAKRLWLSHLQHLSAEQIIAAAHKAIKESEYLPTIRGLLKFCDSEYDMYGLPDVRAAYIEACMASSAPQDRANWSHPAVYYAGRESDWFFLANNPEKQTYPVFEHNYQLLCQRVRKGEELSLPTQKALPEKIVQPLSQQEQLERLEAIKKIVS